MGTKLNTSSGTNTPVVSVKEKKGTYFVGMLKGYRAQESGYKNEKTGADNPYHIYEFGVVDTDMGVQIKQGKEYVDTDIGENAVVCLFAPTRLHNALKQASMGQTIKITYLGLGKATKFGGKPHEYDVEVV